MKLLIPILIGLLVVGCGKNKQSNNTGKGNNTPENSAKKEVKETPSNNSTAKPAEELTIEDVAGNYELKLEGGTAQMVILENGKIEFYENGKKNLEEAGLKMAGNEIHFDSEGGDVRVFRIELNGDLTYIAEIERGERYNHAKDMKKTFKKIK